MHAAQQHGLSIVEKIMLDEILRQRLGDAAPAAERTTVTPAATLPLQPGKAYHFYVCNHDGYGGDQTTLLCDGLKLIGFKVWHDGDQTADQRNFERARRGVEGAECLLLFLSGRKETGRHPPDPKREYESPFTLPLCHEAMHAAHLHGLGVVGVMESEVQMGEPDFGLEKPRALSRNTSGQPTYEHAASNAHLLDDVCFIPFRREPHEWRAMLVEIMRQRKINPLLVCVGPDGIDDSNASDGGSGGESLQEHSVCQSGGGRRRERQAPL